MSPAEKIVAAVRERTGSEPKREGKGQTLMRCPAHEDGTASLSVATGDNGAALVHCHAGCSIGDVLAAIGLSKSDMFDGPSRSAASGLDLESYAHALGVPAAVMRGWGVTKATHYGRPAVRIAYYDVRGHEIGHKLRKAMRGSGQEKFHTPKGSKVKGRLYGAEQLANARAAGSVIVVEGESDTHVLWGAGFSAVAIPGADMWDETTNAPMLDGIATVYVVHERIKGDGTADQGGETVLKWISKSKIRDRVKIVDLGEHNDPRGLYNADRTNFKESFQAALDRAQPWADVDAEQKAAAEGAPVDGAVLLDDLAAFVRRFVVVSSAEAQALALFVVHTWTMEAADATPFISVTSAEKGSGKTRLLEVLELLVRAPWRVVTPSASVVYRKIERDAPTLLLDETDSIFKDRSSDSSEALRGILNAGNRRGAKVAVNVPAADGGWEPGDFSVFGPRVLAGIGTLPDTITDRSIPVRLRKRRRDEAVERFRPRTVGPDVLLLRDRVERWALQHVDGLVGREVADLVQLDERKVDAWEPLLAIADDAGGPWPARARTAAVELSGPGTTTDTDSDGLLLLRDLKAVWPGTGNARTEALIDALKQLDEAPWADWRRGQGLSPRSLSKLLASYGIRSSNVRLEGSIFKGYKREDLADAWARYVPDPVPNPPTPPSAAPNPLHRYNPQPERDCRSSASATPPDDVADGNGRKPAWTPGCSGVADTGPVQGGSDVSGVPGGDFDWRTETVPADPDTAADRNGDRP